jgi:alpha,alpha-trehalose phosphorylase
MDLADVAGNVHDGCHIASMGGFWMTLIYGFAGMRDNGGRITFAPRVPPELGGLRFPLEIRGQRLEVDLTPERATYLLKGTRSLTVGHEGEIVELQPEEPVTRAVSAPHAPAPDRNRDPAAAG